MLSTIQQKDFLLFLSYCLSPDSQALPECAAHICWADLQQFAKKQSVVGVYWQGVKRMSGLETNRPSEDDVMDWMVEVSKIAKRNRKVNAVAVKVVYGFRQQGFDACVLKGQGNALLYPTPSSRTPVTSTCMYIRSSKETDGGMTKLPSEKSSPFAKSWINRQGRYTIISISLLLTRCLLRCTIAPRGSTLLSTTTDYRSCCSRYCRVRTVRNMWRCPKKPER